MAGHDREVVLSEYLDLCSISGCLYHGRNHNMKLFEHDK
jgi:hypothetical protein